MYGRLSAVCSDHRAVDGVCQDGAAEGAGQALRAAVDAAVRHGKRTSTVQVKLAPEIPAASRPVHQMVAPLRCSVN